MERLATMQLMNKAIAFAKQNNPLSVLSVTCSENVEGFIYAEAFKEIHVREAIKGLSSILGGKITLVPHEEMPVLYHDNKSKESEISKH